MTGVNITQDHYSIQITAPNSRRFYVRLTDPEMIGREAKFSDFILDEGELELAQEALTVLATNTPSLLSARKWTFSDLLPRPAESLAIADSELIRRFDEINQIVGDFIKKHNIEIENAFLEPRLGEFDGIFVLKYLGQAAEGVKLK